MSNLVARTLLATSIAVSTSVWAQAQGTRIAGKIERINGSSLVIKTAQAEQTVNLAANADVVLMGRGTVADVKTGSFIGVGASPQSDGSQKAIQVTIFSESMRGLGEGHRPWNRPNTTMTNAAVDTMVTGVDGPVLTVKYKDGMQKIVIGPEATITFFTNGSRADLKPGASVAFNATTPAGGNALEATRVAVGRGDYVPN